MAGSISVAAPSWVGVAAKSGAVYVLTTSNTVVKFSGLENAKEVARLELKPAPGKNQSWKVAVDGAAEPAVLWAALGSSLVRSEDSGATFSALTPAGCYTAQLYWRPAADPTRKDVLCKIRGE